VVHHHAMRIMTPFPKRVLLIQCSRDQELRQIIAGYGSKVVEKVLDRPTAGLVPSGFFLAASRFAGRLAFHAPHPPLIKRHWL
jgi:hypothetical protein